MTSGLWRYVFDVKRIGCDIDIAAGMARDAGYGFMAFNGILYFVGCQRCKGITNTGISTRELG